MAFSGFRAAAVVAVIALLASSVSAAQHASESDSVTFQIAESIPLGVDFTPDMTVFEAMYSIITNAQEEVDIACMYMTLDGASPEDGGTDGQDVYNAIVAAAKRGVKVRIAKSVSKIFGHDDVEKLVAGGFAQAAYVNYTELIGAGILHTKFIVGDGKALFVGSANFDWRSLEQVKELGIYFGDAPQVAAELLKVFEQYWILGTTHAIPASWPASLETNYTMQSPMQLTMNGTDSELFFSLSPPPCIPSSWTLDSDAIVNAMMRAEEFIWIEVMDYMPAIVYSDPNTYWNVIDNAIRVASFNNKTQVHLLIGYWEHSMPLQQDYVQSLNALPNVTVKYFIVPPFKVNIPYTRVNHAKWMITDKELFIDTSNWTGDYFVNTAGVGTNTNNEAARYRGMDIFTRDWDSEYTHDIPASG